MGSIMKKNKFTLLFLVVVLFGLYCSSCTKEVNTTDLSGYWVTENDDFSRKELGFLDLRNSKELKIVYDTLYLIKYSRKFIFKKTKQDTIVFYDSEIDDEALYYRLNQKNEINFDSLFLSLDKCSDGCPEMNFTLKKDGLFGFQEIFRGKNTIKTGMLDSATLRKMHEQFKFIDVNVKLQNNNSNVSDGWLFVFVFYFGNQRKLYFGEASDTPMDFIPLTIELHDAAERIKPSNASEFISCSSKILLDSINNSLYGNN
jgi:hypothetical protein